MSGRFRVIVGAALTLIIGHGALAAESGPPLRIGHYSTGSGLIGFVIDRMGTPIKLRFDGSDEILALTAEQAPYSSMTLKRDDGVSVLRIYETGRILIFSDKLSGGSADAFSRPGSRAARRQEGNERAGRDRGRVARTQAPARGRPGARDLARRAAPFP